MGSQGLAGVQDGSKDPGFSLGLTWQVRQHCGDLGPAFYAVSVMRLGTSIINHCSVAADRGAVYDECAGAHQSNNKQNNRGIIM